MIRRVEYCGEGVVALGDGNAVPEWEGQVARIRGNWCSNHSTYVPVYISHIQHNKCFSDLSNM